VNAVGGFFRDSLAGWKSVLRAITGLLLIACFAGVLGFVVVYPLWYLSTHHTAFFTWLVLGLVGVFGVTALVLRTVRAAGEPPRVLATLGRLGFALLVLGALYGTLVIGSLAGIWAAVPLAVVVLLVIGYGIAARGRKQ
jgi:hypothetical protein